MNNNGGQVTWTFDVDNTGLNKGLDQASSNIASFARTADRTLSSSFKSYNNSMIGLGKSISGISFKTLESGAQVATTALTILGTKGISTGSYMQSLQLQMNGLTKSVELGAQAMKAASDYWQENPFQRVDVAATTKTLLALGREVKDISGDLKLLGNVSVTTGVPLQSLGMIFGQISASGRIMGGEIMQLTQNGVAILPALQKELGKTAEEVRDLASRGEIDFETFRKALGSIVDPTIIDQMTNTLPRQMDRFGGAMTALALAFTGGVQDIEKGYIATSNGILQAVTTLVKNVTDTLKVESIAKAATEAGNALAPFIDKISNLFKVVGEGAEATSPAAKVITGFFNFIKELGPFLIPILALLAISFSGLFSQIPIIGEMIGGIAGQIRAFTSSLGNLAKSGADLFIGSFGDAISRIPSVASATVSVIKDLSSRAIDLGKNGFAIAKDAIDKFQQALPYISAFMGPEIAIMSKFADTVRTKFNSAVSSISESISKVAASVSGKMSEIAQSIVEKVPAIKTAADGIKNAFNNVSANIGLQVVSIKTQIGLFVEEFARSHPRIVSYASLIGDGVQAALSKIPSAVTDSVSKISGVAGKVGGAVSNVLGGAINIVGASVSKIGSLVGSVASSLTGPLLAGMFAVGTAAATMGGEFMNQVNGMINTITIQGPKMAIDFTNNILGMANAITVAMPQLMVAFSSIFTTIANFIITNGPTLITTFTNIVIQMVNEFVNPANIALFAEAIVTLVTSLATNLLSLLPVLFEAMIQIITGLIVAFSDPAIIDQLITALLDFIVKMAELLITNLPIILNAMVTLITRLINRITQPDLLDKLIDATITLIVTIAVALIENLPKLIEAMVRIIVALARALTKPENLEKMKNGAKEIIKAIGDMFAQTDWGKIGTDLVKGLWHGIKDMGAWIAEKIRGFGEGVMNSLKNFFGIESPSKLMRDEVGNMLGEGIGVGIMDSTKFAVKAAKDSSRDIMNAFSTDDIASHKISAEVEARYSPRVIGSGAVERNIQPTSSAATINQTNYVYTELDMDLVNRNLTWELNKL